MNTKPATPAARYDRALQLARHRHLPPGAPRPQPTAAWPAENIALLEHYNVWLLASGASPYVVQHLYVPVAGHVLGLNLKPHPQLNLETDLARGLDYIQAKRLSDEWASMNRNAVVKFRHYLQQQRGQRAVSLPAPDLSYY